MFHEYAQSRRFLFEQYLVAGKKRHIWTIHYFFIFIFSSDDGEKIIWAVINTSNLYVHFFYICLFFSSTFTCLMLIRAHFLTIPHYSKEAARFGSELFFCKVDLTNWPLAFVSVCGIAHLLGVVFCMKPSFFAHKNSSHVALLVRTPAIMTRIWGFWKLFIFFLSLCFWLVRLPMINQDLRTNVVIFSF